MDLIRQLRSIEAGAMPASDDIAQFGDARLGEAIRAKSPDHDKYRLNAYNPEEEEAKDGTVSSILDKEAIMAIVDEPFSTSTSEHREQSIPLSFYRKLIPSSKRKGGSKASKTSKASTSIVNSIKAPSVPLTLQQNSVTSELTNFSGAEGSFASSFANATSDMALPPPDRGSDGSTGVLPWDKVTQDGKEASIGLPPGSKANNNGMKGEISLFGDHNLSQSRPPVSNHHHSRDTTGTHRILYSEDSDIRSETSHDNDGLSIHSLHSVNSKDTTVQNVRKMREVERRWNKDMEERRESIYQGIQKDVRKIGTEIGVSVELLPVELLIKHGHFDLVKERALTRMWKLLLKMRLNMLHSGVKRWRLFVETSKNDLLMNAGALIVRIARGRLGRLAFKRRLLEFHEHLRKAGRMEAVKKMGLLAKVIMIQAAFRRKIAYRKVKPLLRMHRAAVYVAIFFRKQSLVIAAKRQVREAKFLKGSATKIQKIIRAYFGRKRFRERRKEHTNALFRKRYETPESTMQYYFEQGGAATKLQHWFRNLPWYVKDKWRRKYLAYYTQRKAIWADKSGRLEDKKKRADRKRSKAKKRKQLADGNAYGTVKANTVEENRLELAEAINHIVRGFLGRGRVSRLRRDLAVLAELKLLGAVVIQKHIRRVLAIKRMSAMSPGVGVRTRAALLKEKKWAGSLNWHDCNDQRYLAGLRKEESYWSAHVLEEQKKMKRMGDREKRMYLATPLDPSIAYTGTDYAADFELALRRAGSRDRTFAACDGGVSAGWGKDTLSRGASHDGFQVVAAGEGGISDDPPSEHSPVGQPPRPGSSVLSRGGSAGIAGPDGLHSRTSRGSRGGEGGSLLTPRSHRPTTGLAGAAPAPEDRHPQRPSLRLLHAYPALHASVKRIAPYAREYAYIHHHRDREEHRLRLDRELRHTSTPHGDEDAALRMYLQKRRSAVVLGPHYRYHTGGGFGKPKSVPVYKPTREQRGVKDKSQPGGYQGSGHHHLQICKAADVDAMSKAARSIGRAYRASVSRVQFRKFMENKQSLYGWKLTRWVRVCLIRRRILRLHKLITEVLVGTIRDDNGKLLELPLWQRVIRRRKAARSIQGVYRVHVSVLWLRNFKKARAEGTLQIQRFFRRRIVADRQRRFQLNRLRSILETRNAGEQQYNQTIIFKHIDKLWWGAQKTRTLSVPYDLQKYFTLSGSGSMLEASRLLKQLQSVAKETDLYKVEEEEEEDGDGDGEDDQHASNKKRRSTPLSPQAVEDLFLRCKALSDKRISYEHFLDLLMNLAAVRFLGIDPAVLATGPTAKPLFKRVATILNMSGSSEEGTLSREEKRYQFNNIVQDEDAVSVEQCMAVAECLSATYGRLRGRPALIIKFIMRYLSHVTEFKKGCGQLAKKASIAMATAEVEGAVELLQVWARNRLTIKRIDHGWSLLRQRKLAAQRARAATKINGLVRSFLGRVHIMKMAQSIYSKYVDTDTGGVYWFNPRTQAAFWTKPGLLGTRDCGNPVHMPTPDEQYVVPCMTCDANTEGGPNGATIFCDDCEEQKQDALYCQGCFEVSHRSHAKRDHLKILLTLCVQCDFQAGTRYCMRCQDTFCDSCFKFVHRKGRLSLHIWEPCTQQCDVCGDRSAQWSRSENDGTGIVKYFCVVCYKDTFGLRRNYGEEDTGDEIHPYNEDGGEAHGAPSISRFKFQGHSVKQYRGARDEAARKAEIARAFAERKAELANLKLHRSATHIQRRARGMMTRAAIQEFQAQQREFMRIREKEAVLRENPIYRFMAYWGVAPALRGSTMLEKVLLSYPVHMHDILRDCINEEYKMACQLQREQEEHLQRQGNPSTLELLRARIGAARAAQRYKQCERKLARKMAELEAKKFKYREEKNRADAKKAVVQELQEAAVSAGQEAQELTKVKHDLHEASRAANLKVVSFVGPRGLQELVSDKRKNGISLPFRVHLFKGSRLAEVRYDDPPSPLSKEEIAEKQERDAARAVDLATIIGTAGADPHVVEAAQREMDELKNPLNSQQKLLQYFADRKQRQKVLDEKRQPVKDQDGYFVIDADGKAVDSFGNRLEVDKHGRPVLCEDDSQFKIEVEEDPTVTNPLYGSWTKYVNEGDALLINGVTFKVLSRGEFIYDMVTDVAEEDEEKDEEDEDEEDDDEGSSDGEEMKKEIDEEDIDYQDKRHKRWDLEIANRPKFSDDMICLDRPWVLEDATFQAVRKVVPKKFYVKPIEAAGRALLSSWGPQKIIQITAINSHKLSKLSLYLSTLFDAESEMGLSLKERSASLEATRDNILRLSRQVVDYDSFDFTARRKMWKTLKHRVEAFVKYLRMMRSRAAAAAGDENAGLDFETWEASQNKVPVAIYLEVDNRPDEKLGEITVDLTAPVYIMRLLLYRNDDIRDRLNALQGVNFQFFVVKDNEEYDEDNPEGNVGVDSSIDWLLERDKEKQTYTHDFAPFKMDNKTMEGGNRCSIVLDKEFSGLAPHEHELCPRLDKRGRVIEAMEAQASGEEEGSVAGSAAGSVATGSVAAGSVAAGSVAAGSVGATSHG